MNTNLEFWKGSSGYSIPGGDGNHGEEGKSIHFSSIDASTNDASVFERITAKKCLSNNPNVNYSEQYKDQDYILDIYGDLYMLTGVDQNNPQLSYTGNIFFHHGSEKYHAAIDSNSNECVLNFKIGKVGRLKSGDYVKHNATSDSESSPLWNHRWNDYRYAQKMPCIEIVPSTSDTLLYDSSIYTSEEFISHISETEIYHKICAVMNNGLVIEKITSANDTGIIIELGYINMIDSSLTNLSVKTSFDTNSLPYRQETSISANIIAPYKNFLKSENNRRMCNMYFEYSHDNEMYRMKLNVTQ